MIEENVGTVIEGETLPEKQTATTEVARDFESEAREMGWVPESEFRGAKDKWKPAEQFVTEGENFIPFLKANERKLRRELKAKDEDFSARLERMERVNKANYERDIANYQARITELEAKQELAVEAGDKAEFRRLKTEINKTPIPQEPDVGAGAVTPPNLEEQWAAENPWYGTDKTLTAFAFGFSNNLASEYLEEHGVELSMADNLKQTLAEVKKTFPSKFAKSNGNGHAAVDSGGAFSAPQSRSDPLSRLPAEARAQAKVDMEKYPKVYKTAADWIKVYEGKV